MNRRQRRLAHGASLLLFNKGRRFRDDGRAGFHGLRWRCLFFGYRQTGVAAMIFFGQTVGFALLSPVYDNFGAIPIFLVTAIAFPIIALGFRSTLKKTTSA